MIRVGHGYDSHRFKDGDFILLGGVKIPSKKSVVAHSDGDILIHAICDALLGATGNGDLGKYFDNSDEFKNMNNLKQKVGYIPIDKLNLYGGSLSLGHPFGATGVRLLSHASQRLIDTKGDLALIASCAAGGLGHAMLIKNVHK